MTWTTHYAILVVLSVTYGFIGQLQADALINFNTASTDLSSNFTEQGQTAGTNFTWISNTGVSNTGTINVSGAPETAYYNTTQTGFSSTLTTYTLSASFRAVSSTTGTAGNSAFALGWIGATTDLLGTNSGTNTYLLMTVNAVNTTAGNDTLLQMSFRSKSGSSAQTSSSAAGTFTLTNGEWYQYVTTYTFDSLAGTFVATGSIYDTGANGDSTTPTLVTSFTSTALSNASFATDTDIYAGFRSAALGYAGANRIDDFAITAVPEPSTMACLMLALLGGTLGLRRRAKTLHS